MVDVVVIGAGLAGLAAARDVAAGGRSVLVLEARDRVGGRTYNHTFADGTVVELGGQWVGPTQDRVLALAADVGAATFPTHTKGEHLTGRDGRVVRYRGRGQGLPPLVLAEIALAQTRLERMARRVPLDQPWAAPDGERWDARTFETWITRNLRTDLARRFYRLVAEAVFAAEPAELSLLHFLFYCHSGGLLDRLLGTRGGAQQDRVVGGSAVLCQRMAERLGSDAVRLASPVVGVDQTGDRVRVTHADGTVEADRVVVSVPAAVVGRIRFAPGLPAQRSQLHQRMPMGRVIKCVARYDEAFWRADGLSGQAASVDDPVSVIYDNSPPDGRSGVLVGFLEGDHARQAGQLDADGRRRLVVGCFAKFFGAAAAEPVEYADLDWATEEWTGGCYGAHLAPGVWTRFGAVLREPCGRVHWAGSETSAVWNGYMDGAVRSGERAAAEVLAALA